MKWFKVFLTTTAIMAGITVIMWMLGNAAMSIAKEGHEVWLKEHHEFTLVSTENPSLTDLKAGPVRLYCRGEIPGVGGAPSKIGSIVVNARIHKVRSSDSFKWTSPDMMLK